MANALCPHCEAPLSHVTLAEMQANADGGKAWTTLGYACPYCRKLISVGIDPIAVKADTVSETVDQIKKILR